MKNPALKHPSTLLVVLSLASIASSLVQAGRRHDSQETNGVQDWPDLVEAVRRGGLREGARIKRHYVASIRTGSCLKYDIESLVKTSQATVTGRSGDGVSRLSSDGQLIVTDYDITLEVIKADSAFRDTVGVSLPGGKVLFEDGSSAEILTPHLKQMESGKVYLLFLSRDKETKQFILTGGGQGLFEISVGNSGVKPHGHSSDVLQKYKGRAVAEFLEEVRAAAR